VVEVSDGARDKLIDEVCDPRWNSVIQTDALRLVRLLRRATRIGLVGQCHRRGRICRCAPARYL
jgi:hypothetical protein